MTEAAKEARKNYLREWRRSNPDKVRAQKARYWERKAEAVRQAAEMTDNMKASEANGRE